MPTLQQHPLFSTPRLARPPWATLLAGVLFLYPLFSGCSSDPVAQSMNLDVSAGTTATGPSGDAAQAGTITGDNTVGGASGAGPATGGTGNLPSAGAAAGGPSASAAGSPDDPGPSDASGDAGSPAAAGGAPAGASGAPSMAGSAGTPAVPGGTLLTVPWDWSGIIGTGQSLSVGDPGNASGTPGAAIRTTTQPFQNLKLSTGSAPFPVDPNAADLALVPLTEPVGRRSTAFPSAWPTNIAGETYHSAMGNQIAQLVQAEGQAYVSVHGEVGENGQCLSFLVKGATATGDTGHAYQASLTETTAITRLAQAAGRSYGVGAIVVTHGECDAGNANYEAQLRQLWADYSVDLPAITGQTRPPLLIVSQQNSINDNSASTLAQWRIGLDFPDEIVCSGPKYQYPYAPDAVHLIVDGYQGLGEKYAQVYIERVLRGSAWQPLQLTTATRSGRVITVNFQVPVPPLAWEETFQPPHQAGVSEWSAGRGFELRSGATPLPIASVAIAGDAVQVTAAVDLPATGVTVAYALTASSAPMQTPFAGTTRWGQLRDSDPFVGGMTGRAQPNFAVAFQIAVP